MQSDSEAPGTPGQSKVEFRLCQGGVCTARGSSQELPTRLDSEKCAAHLKCDEDGLGVAYDGPGQMDKESAAAVKADHPVPTSGIALYYFEATVIDAGSTGGLGIGFSGEGVKLEKMPGWEPCSFGYHGDDGFTYNETGLPGDKYGPKFGMGDVVGCCWDMVDGTVFFTKNGLHLGVAFRGLRGTLYPTIGMQTKGGRFTINFGASPFKYDIESFAREQRERVMGEIMSFPAHADTRLVADTVLGYLIHFGHAKTARAFARESGHPSATSDGVDMRNGLVASSSKPSAISESKATVVGEEPSSSKSLVGRPDTKQLRLDGIEDRREVLAKASKGDIDGALAFARDRFPGWQMADPDTEFLVKTQQFIEMLCADDTELSEAVMFGRTQLLPLYESYPKRLQEVYCLLAYKDPRTSPVMHLTSQDRRDLVAAKLNAAILEFQGQPANSTLSRMLSQTQTLLEAYAEAANGPANLLRNHDFCS